MGDARLAALRDWIGGIETIAGCEPVVASTDASFRRYFRVVSGNDSYIIMDAPPEQEDSLPFVRVAGYLESMGLNAPRVLEADLVAGFLLLTDLGTQSYLDALEQQPGGSEALYNDAMMSLLAMQQRGEALQALLPPYDEKLLRFELSLFHDWLCELHCGVTFTAEDEAHWQSLCAELVDNALLQPQVFVHRDYHSRNLMRTEHDNPGILDFQDAVEGPLTYDLVSLLKDCYIRWPASQVTQWALEFYGHLDAALRTRIDEQLFRRNFELMGVQRHLKAAGIFARLNHRDGKARYLADIPRTLSYIAALGDEYEELRFVVDLIERQVLPAFGEWA